MRPWTPIALAALALGLGSAAHAASLTTNVGKSAVTAKPPSRTGWPINPIAPDCAPCRPGDINENEPNCCLDYYDYTNGGCNSTGWTNLYPTSSAGVSHACGTSGTYYVTDPAGGFYSYCDTDWFRATAAFGGPVSMTVKADFDPELILMYAPAGVISCSNYTFVYCLGLHCPAVSTLIATVPARSEIWPWVAPQVFGTGVPCGSRYTLDVTNTLDMPDRRAARGSQAELAGPVSVPGTWGMVKTLFRWGRTRPSRPSRPGGSAASAHQWARGQRGWPLDRQPEVGVAMRAFPVCSGWTESRYHWDLSRTPFSTGAGFDPFLSPFYSPHVPVIRL